MFQFSIGFHSIGSWIVAAGHLPATTMLFGDLTGMILFLFFTKWSGWNSIWLSILEKRARIFNDCPYVWPSFYAITFYSIDVLEL